MEFSLTLLSVALVWGVAVATPGPNFFIVVQTAMSQGRKSALLVVLGVCCGALLWGVSGYLGLALLFKLAPWLFAVMKILGGFYLIYLGWKMIKNSTPPTTGAAASPGGALRCFRSGMLTILSNPKTAAFVASLFAATLPAETPLWLGLSSVALMGAVSMLWYSLVALLFSSRRAQQGYARWKTWINRTAGTIFIGFGAALASDSLDAA